MSITNSTKLFTKTKLNIKALMIAVAIIVGMTVVPAQVTRADSLAKVNKISVKKQKSKLWGRKYVTGFKISWKKVSGAKGYKVYAYGVASKKWRCIKTTKKTSYTLTRLVSKSKAKIKVRAYKNNPDGSTTFGKFSKSVNCKAKDDVYKASKNGKLKKSFHDRYAAEQAFVLQNKMRRDAGVSNIVWSERLYELCEIRAKQVSKDFSHDKFRSASESYLKQFGINDRYVYHREEDGSYGLSIIGTENIADGQMNYKSAMQSWKNSKPHYGNLKNKDHVSGAIACYMSKDTGICWVAIFSDVDVDKTVDELKTK
jgi:uncharacterized protein YkwD